MRVRDVASPQDSGRYAARLASDRSVMGRSWRGSSRLSLCCSCSDPRARRNGPPLSRTSGQFLAWCPLARIVHLFRPSGAGAGPRGGSAFAPHSRRGHLPPHPRLKPRCRIARCPCLLRMPTSWAATSKLPFKSAYAPSLPASAIRGGGAPLPEHECTDRTGALRRRLRSGCRGNSGIESPRVAPWIVSY